MPSVPGGRVVQTVAAFLLFVSLTAVMTWPLAAGLGRDVPADLGDSLLNMWIMAWDAEAFMGMAAGRMSFGDLWNANIFAPTPLSLTFSEHLVPQALQGLPFYLATGNIVLAYDVVFLSTFVLSGLGMFLLVRELTGSARAGLVAGLFYAFLPYRLGQFPHIQTLSSQWMPFALYGMRRYFDTGHLLSLAGGAAAFALQGLSTGYYLFYFAPVFGAYVLWEVIVRGRWRDVRTWLSLGGAGLATLAVMAPFLRPYQQARAQLGLERAYGELLTFSADLYAYVNAPPQAHLWGPTLNRFPQPEGDLFFGAVPWLMALASVGLWAARARVASRDTPFGRTPFTERLAVGLVLATAAVVVAAILIALTGGGTWTIGGIALRATSVRRTLAVGALLLLAGLIVSPRWREAARSNPTDLTPLLVAAIVFAIVMSLGPAPRAGGGRLSGLELYRLFFDYVPGFDGLRVPARFAMVAAAMLATLAGYSLGALARRRFGTAALTVLGVAFLAESYAAPVDVNVNWEAGTRYERPWSEVHRLNEGPLAYRHLLLMPNDTTVVELPFGDRAWDLRYVYYAGLHGKRIVNGYSGYFPPDYGRRTAQLQAALGTPVAAWEAVTSAGATHVLVHESAFRGTEGPATTRWAERMGATRVATFADGDVLLAVPRP
ncbi:MAG: hypothetical protein R2745_09305 [Vicinamibacterales bacterium]